MNFSAGKLVFIMTACIMIKLVITSEHTFSPKCGRQQSPCATLSDFAFPSSGNILMNFLPGVHSLPAETTVRNRDMFVIMGTSKQTFIDCNAASRFRAHLQLEGITRIRIENVTFRGCNFEIRTSNNTFIYRSVFLNSEYGALEFFNSFNVSIDRSSFKNNSESSFDGVLQFERCNGIEITRCNFTNNDGSNFHNNSASSFGGVIKADNGGNFLFITNSTFTNNNVGAFGGIINIDSSGDFTVIISCVFSFNNAGSFGSDVRVDGATHATVLASSFSHNRAGGFGGSIKTDSRNSRATVDCTQFFNNSRNFDVEPNTLSLFNSTLCAETYALGEEGTCLDNDDCEGKCWSHDIKLQVSGFSLAHCPDPSCKACPCF